LQRHKQKREPRVRINERILYNTESVRVIDVDGEQLGVLDTKIALHKAKDQGLDLVEVSPNAKPPVCRILDYGKFKYEEAKKAKAAKARQHVVKLKEVKFHPRTDYNDYRYRLERGKEFLEKGCKLKATVVFRGREMAHMEYGGRWLKQMQEDLEGIAGPESPIKQEGRNMSVIFAPLKQKPQPKPKANKEEPAKEAAAKAEAEAG
jgi:translation initiation factor IF-3